MHGLIKNPLKSENGNPVYKHGIYSKNLGTIDAVINQQPVQDNVSGIAHRVDGIRLEDSNPVTPKVSTKLLVLTQGDKLNQIKARRTMSPNMNITANAANQAAIQ